MSTTSEDQGHQAMWPKMIAALAEIDAALGLPEDGCNSTARTLSEIARLRAELERCEKDAELARLRKIETAAKLSCGLLWMTAEWRQGKTDAAYQALLEAVGGSGSQGLRESIQAALAAGHEVDAPPGCYWPENT